MDQKTIVRLGRSSFVFVAALGVTLALLGRGAGLWALVPLFFSAAEGVRLAYGGGRAALPAFCCAIALAFLLDPSRVVLLFLVLPPLFLGLSLRQVRPEKAFGIAGAGTYALFALFWFYQLSRLGQAGLTVRFQQVFAGLRSLLASLYDLPAAKLDHLLHQLLQQTLLTMPASLFILAFVITGLFYAAALLFSRFSRDGLSIPAPDLRALRPLPKALGILLMLCAFLSFSQAEGTLATLATNGLTALQFVYRMAGFFLLWCLAGAQPPLLGIGLRILACLMLAFGMALFDGLVLFALLDSFLDFRKRGRLTR